MNKPDYLGRGLLAALLWLLLFAVILALLVLARLYPEEISKFLLVVHGYLEPNPVP